MHYELCIMNLFIYLCSVHSTFAFVIPLGGHSGIVAILATTEGLSSQRRHEVLCREGPLKGGRTYLKKR